MSVTRSQQRSEALGVTPEDLLDVMRTQFHPEGSEIGDRSHRLVRGNTDRGRGVPELHVEVHQHAPALAFGECGREVGRHERSTAAAARRVDREHGRPLPDALLSRRPHPRGRDRQLLSLGRPQVEAARTRSDGSTQCTDGLRCVHDEERAAVQRPTRRDEGGGGDHRIRLQLPNGLGELGRVNGRPHDSRAARAIEEVHDLLGDVR